MCLSSSEWKNQSNKREQNEHNRSDYGCIFFFIHHHHHHQNFSVFFSFINFINSRCLMANKIVYLIMATLHFSVYTHFLSFSHTQVLIQNKMIRFIHKFTISTIDIQTYDQNDIETMIIFIQKKKNKIDFPKYTCVTHVFHLSLPQFNIRSIDISGVCILQRSIRNFKNKIT